MTSSLETPQESPGRGGKLSGMDKLGILAAFFLVIGLAGLVMQEFKRPAQTLAPAPFTSAVASR